MTWPGCWTRTPVWSAWPFSTRWPPRWCRECCASSTSTRAPGAGGAHPRACPRDPGRPRRRHRGPRHHLHAPHRDHGWHPLQEERLLLVVPPQHRLADRRRVRLAELEGEEVVTTPLGFGYRSLVEGLFGDAGVVPRVSFEGQDLATIEGLVAAGLGFAILPEQFSGISGTRGITITSAGALRTIGLVSRGDRPLPPPAERFRAFVVAAPST